MFDPTQLYDQAEDAARQDEQARMIVEHWPVDEPFGLKALIDFINEYQRWPLTFEEIFGA